MTHGSIQPGSKIPDSLPHLPAKPAQPDQTCLAEPAARSPKPETAASPSAPTGGGSGQQSASEPAQQQPDAHSQPGHPHVSATSKPDSPADPADRADPTPCSPQQPAQSEPPAGSPEAQTQPETQPTGSPDVLSAMQAISRVVGTTGLCPGSQDPTGSQRVPASGPAASPARPSSNSAGRCLAPQPAAELPAAAADGAEAAAAAEAADALDADLPGSFHLSLDFGDTQAPEVPSQLQTASIQAHKADHPAQLPLQQPHDGSPKAVASALPPDSHQATEQSQPPSPSQSLPVWHGGRTGHVLLTQQTQGSQLVLSSPAAPAPAGAPACSPTPSLPTPQAPAGPLQPAQKCLAKAGSRASQPQSDQQHPTKPGHAASGRARSAAQPAGSRRPSAAASSMMVADSQDAPNSRAVAPATSPAASSPSTCVADSPPAAACRMPVHDQSLPYPGPTPPALSAPHQADEAPAAGLGGGSPYAPQPAERAKRRHARGASRQPLRTKPYASCLQVVQ